MTPKRSTTKLLQIILATIILMAAFRPGIHPVTATVENKVYLPNISRSSSIQVNGTNTLIPTSYTWKYLDNGTDQGTAWRQSNYDDRQWKSGPAELGYGDGDERTRVNYGSDPSHKYVTTYFRSQFTATAISSYESLTIRLNRDDAVIVYLNGIEIYRNNLPDGEVGYRTYAKSAADGTIEARVDKSALVEGTNLLAVEIHQASASSSDISFSLVLIANIGAPVVQPTDTPSTRPTTQPTEPPTQGNAWYVAPNGSSSGQGTMASPWDLSTALAYPAAVHPGDTIWLRGGTYGSGGTTEFQSNLQGSSGNFITVRAFPGEKVTVDGSFMILKGYVTFWGLEVLNSNTTRVTAESGSHPSDERGDGFGVYAPNVRLINNIVHDTNGVSSWQEGVDTEIYGNLIYNSGWQGPDRGHGHGMYMQNATGTKQIRDNIIFNNYSNYNVHIYTEKGTIQGFNLDGNVSFNGETLVGGLQPAAAISLNQNYFYNGYVQMGYSSEVINHSLSLTNNLFASNGPSLLEIKLWDGLTSTANTFITPSGKAVVYSNTVGGGFQWNNNSFVLGSSSPFSINSSSKTWDNWRASTGFDSGSAYRAGQPTGVQVIVRPNQYEAKRASIVVYNWDRQNSVSVDLSNTGLQVGDAYVLHNGENWTETITGTYQGMPVSIPMTGWTIAVPTGASGALKPATYPIFGVFVLTVGQ